jgi:hypothetical protein
MAARSSLMDEEMGTQSDAALAVLELHRPLGR